MRIVLFLVLWTFHFGANAQMLVYTVAGRLTPTTLGDGGGLQLLLNLEILRAFGWST
ncbi:MAG: hypothetical protein K0Q79_2710 [Flavipsychrobacter sp.]|jgi:hypothetical protein|nr:hypothetical protein [Flavipsychrobacter sp.]